MALTDTSQLNNLVFYDGNIQVSPQHLIQLNNKPPVLFKAKNFTSTPAVGYKVFLTGYASYILNQEKNTHIYFTLERILNQLRANPRPFENAYQLKRSVDGRKITMGKYDVWYKIHSGQVLVFNIVLNDEAQLARDRLEKPGLYKITKTAEGNWTKSFAATSITTDYAAVNGMLNNLNKATWLMGAHLDAEFGKSTMKEYTLFHNPSSGWKGDLWESARDRLGFSTEVTRQFSKVLQDSQKQGKEIKWVAHSQGGIIFAEAVRYFLNGNSSWAIFGGFNGIFKDKKEIDLSNHKVVFHGNGNNNFRSSFLFERAGIEVLAAHANDYDIVNTLGFNTLNPRKIIGSIVYLNHVTSGSVQQSPHTLPQSQQQWDKNMTSGPGRGRGPIQQGFETSVKYIQNFLK